ncbi:MAG: AbrB/MazE/SpoVT family DNA-binding domain-containing protein [FCB group bacterium]|jgi:bifunctional DNA-binding transcriptional regulator/antitoxin component of YhaV-PrlF toxin-antitoxin module|nr:AbrB/MazE/SpoVT family DNA-binding domain-containing protein [FCB group bacterium]
MSSRVFAVRYEVQSQNWRSGQFSIPADVAQILALQLGDDVVVEVASAKGSKTVITKAKSGLEVYGQFGEHVEPSELVVVGLTKINAFG